MLIHAHHRLQLMHSIGCQLNHSRSAAGRVPLVVDLSIQQARATAVTPSHPPDDRAQPAPTKFGIRVCRTRQDQVSRQPCSLIATRGGARHGNGVGAPFVGLAANCLNNPGLSLFRQRGLWQPCTLPSRSAAAEGMHAGDDDGCAAPRSSTLFSPRRFFFFSSPTAQVFPRPAHPSRQERHQDKGGGNERGAGWTGPWEGHQRKENVQSPSLPPFPSLDTRHNPIFPLTHHFPYFLF